MPTLKCIKMEKTDALGPIAELISDTMWSTKANQMLFLFSSDSTTAKENDIEYRKQVQLSDPCGFVVKAAYGECIAGALVVGYAREEYIWIENARTRDNYEVTGKTDIEHYKGRSDKTGHRGFWPESHYKQYHEFSHRITDVRRTHERKWPKGVWMIAELAVKPQYRGQEVQTKLLDDVKARADEEAKGLLIMTCDENMARWYESQGLRKTPYLENGETHIRNEESILNLELEDEDEEKFEKEKFYVLWREPGVSNSPD